MGKMFEKWAKLSRSGPKKFIHGERGRERRVEVEMEWGWAGCDHQGTDTMQN